MNGQPDRDRVANLVRTHFASYLAYLAMLEVSRDPRSDLLTPEVVEGASVPTVSVERRNGPDVHLDFRSALQVGRDHVLIRESIDRAYLMGVLLDVGDALARDGLYDGSPVLEFVYHLRNGIAHGNRFHFTRGGLRRLEERPAHTRQTVNPRGSISSFEICESLDGDAVLFDFMAPGDVTDLLLCVEEHLRSIT